LILVCKYWKIIITEQRKNLTSNPEIKNPLKKNFKEINRETVKQLKLNSVNNDSSVIRMTEIISQNNYSNLLYGEKKFMKKIPEKSPRHLIKNSKTKNEKENEIVKKVQFMNKIVVGERENENESDDKMSFKNVGNLTELIIDDNTEMNNNYNNIDSISIEKNKDKNKDNNSFSGENEEQFILNSIIKNREFDTSDFTKCDEKTVKTNSTSSSESLKHSPTKHKNNNENDNENDDKNGFEITDGENKEQNKNKNDNNVTENNNNDKDNDNTDYHNNNENENENKIENENEYYDNFDDDENGNFDHLLMHVKEIRSESQLTDLIEFIQNRYISIEHTDNEKKKLKKIIKGMKKNFIFTI
jgi:hypothetical protein